MSDTIRVIMAIIWLVIGILYATGVIEASPKVIAMISCFIMMHVLLFG